ncbi:FAD:protein FMN transferase [Desulfocurvibacter africanus]|uniref:FAD:protein FMN transferase n=1 Tax=Desulfocurvibacter africanus subsp. africanus str. Walvis Bay TaxID=690850 RepID=F3Z442_DESAF|nr:FAD:protein FMN transferase [Desulfocurvibacter africanus]EGJ51584.1 ApbE family lipoprotein [Desulfocurvibacter africanus subsp. africanus str. Walvis Bay]
MNSKLFTRRAFIRALGVVGLGAAVTPAPVMAAIRMTETRKIGNAYKVSENRFLLGTFVAITAVHESRQAAENAIGLAFAEIERLSAIFDLHDASTPLAHLNATGRLSDVEPEFFAVMREAIGFNRLSSGAFDATVLPVVQTLKSSGGMHISEKELREALELVDSSAIRLSRSEVHFGKQGMGVTLDGIAKGFIVDRASDVLAANGVANHLINAGGDIRARGARSVGQPWTVAIEDPAKKGDYPAILELKDAAVATSGGYEVFYDAERKHHHVVDPKTAHSPTKSVSVSVTAQTVMAADALSTSVFVMAPKAGLNFIDTLSASECLIVGDTGGKLASRHWNRLVQA